MRFFLLVSFLTAFLMSGVANAGPPKSECAMAKGFRTKTFIDLTLEEPAYDYSTPIAELTKGGEERAKEWLKKNNLEEIWSSDHMKTEGRTKSNWHLKTGLGSRGQKPGYRSEKYCLYMNSINFHVVYKPLIQIAKEYPEGSCMFKGIMAHELRHNEVNKTALKNAVDRLQTDALKIVARIEDQNPLVSKEDFDKYSGIMQEKLMKEMKAYLLVDMKEEMEKNHALIDTPLEYSHDNEFRAACRKEAQDSQ